MGIQLGEGNGIVNPRWFVNELVRSDDISFYSESIYNNLITAALNSDIPPDVRDAAVGAPKEWVVSGFDVQHKTLLEVTVPAGVLISFRGRYWNAGVFGYVASPGQSFLVANAEDNDLALDSGEASDRYDIIECRPSVSYYDPRSRLFRDPITGAVTTSVVNTRTAFGSEFRVVKGTAGSGVAPACSYSSGWVKVAEVLVPSSATSITDDEVFGPDRAAEWTTDSVDRPFCAYPFVYSPTYWYVEGDLVQVPGDGLYECTTASRGGIATSFHQILEYDSGQHKLDIDGTAHFAAKVTVASGGMEITGGIDNNSGGISEAGAISGATSIAGTSLTITGDSTMRKITPESDSTYDLGSDSVRWANIYGDDIYSSSSREDKEDISPFEDSALKYLLRTDIVRFKYRGRDREKIGFIAEDTPDILAAGNKRMDIGNTLGLLIKAVQELYEMNQDLMRRVSVLQKEHWGY